MKKKIKDVRVVSNYKTIIIGAGTGIAISVAISAILAIFILNEYFEITSAVYFPLVVQFISSFVGALVAGKGAGERITGPCAIASALTLTLQICFGVLLFDGVAGNILWGALGCLIGFIAAISICKRPKKMRNRGKKRARFC